MRNFSSARNGIEWKSVLRKKEEDGIYIFGWYEDSLNLLQTEMGSWKMLLLKCSFQDHDYMGFISAFKMHDLALSLSRDEFSIIVSIYLDISWDEKMSRLPNSVGKLQNLQALYILSDGFEGLLK